MNENVTYEEAMAAFRKASTEFAIFANLHLGHSKVHNKAICGGDACLVIYSDFMQQAGAAMTEARKQIEKYADKEAETFHNKLLNLA